MEWLFLSISIVAEVIGTSALKASEAFTRPLPSVLVLVCYAIAFYCLSLTLGRIPLGVAYAIWSGAGIVLVATAGALVFGQRLDMAAVLGIGLILAGVIVINVFSRSGGH